MALPTTNLLAWYDASDADTVTLSGSDVTVVAKKQGSASSVDLTATGTIPYISGVPNAPNCVRLGSNFLTIPSGLTVDRQACTIMHIFRREAVSVLKVEFGMDATTDLLRMQQSGSKLSIKGTAVQDSGIFLAHGYETHWLRGGSSSASAGIGGASGALSAMTAGTLSGGFIGKFSGGFAVGEDWVGSFFYNASLDDSKLNDLLDFCTTYYGAVGRTSTTAVFFDGDSLTNGAQSTNEIDYSYPIVLARNSYEKFVLWNDGTNADTALANTAATNAITFYTSFNAHYSSRIYVYNFGRNDLANSRTAAQLSADIDTWITNIRASDSGAILVGCTIHDSDSGAATQSTFDADRATVNTHIKSTADFDYVADFDADSRLSDRTNSTYFQVDEIHLTDAGYVVRADIVRNVLELNGLIDTTPPTVSDVSPANIAKGATADITITGTGFIDGISAASNYAGAFTVNTTTFNSATEVVVNVTGGTGTAGAYLDALTLTNPDGQTVDVALTLTAASSGGDGGAGFYIGAPGKQKYRRIWWEE